MVSWTLTLLWFYKSVCITCHCSYKRGKSRGWRWAGWRGNGRCCSIWAVSTPEEEVCALPALFCSEEGVCCRHSMSWISFPPYISVRENAGKCQQLWNQPRGCSRARNEDRCPLFTPGLIWEPYRACGWFKHPSSLRSEPLRCFPTPLLLQQNNALWPFASPLILVGPPLSVKLMGSSGIAKVPGSWDKDCSPIAKANLSK